MMNLSYPRRLAYAFSVADTPETASPLGDLRHFIRVYDADLEPPFCRQMLASFDALKRFHRENGRMVRAGLEESAWTELNVSRMADPAFLGFFRSRIDRALERYNRDVRLAIPIPNSPKHADLVLKRYRPGQSEQFQLHFDAINHLANRYLVMLWYLNDVAEGGETRFPQLGVTVAPREGRLVMFPPYWMYQHEGLPPTSGDKYIVSTYLLFIDPQPS
jgi:prolyl 4-hydroxylase